MNAPPPLLQRCFQEAATTSRRVLERCIDETVAQLQAAERGATGQDRDSLEQAWKGLLSQRAAWGPQYAADLLAAFSAERIQATDAGSGMTASAFGTLNGSLSGFAGLTLVDDAEVTQNIEFARLSHHLRLQVDAVMADFDALISAAQGLPSVRPERNPLRPDVFAKVLRRLLETAAVEPECRALWLKGLAGGLGRELRGLYENLIALLEAANVQAVSYRVAPSPVAAGRGGGQRRPEGAADAADPSRREGSEAGARPPVDAPPEVYADPSPADVGGALMQDFLARGGDEQKARLAASYYDRVDQELKALRAEPEAPPPPDPASEAGQRPERRVDGQSPLSPQVWGEYAKPRARKLVQAELKKEATHVGQVLGLEVVRQLVNQVAQDPRLLVPVRESIIALEPSLLRLAMVDPRFFSEETHPGRLLMERVAQRSFKYSDENSPEFQAFFEPVRQTFNALNALNIDSVQPFNHALGSLEAEWTERDRAEEARSHDVLHGLRFAEERQLVADQIAHDLSTRPDLDMVPAPVLDFLFGPWALAMAHARLVDQHKQIDPQGLGVLVSDLVWSVKHEFTLRHPAKLLNMIPPMLRKLNAGLDLIGQDAADRAAFFDLLMRLHRPVLKLRRLKSERDAHGTSAVSQVSDLMPASAEQRIPKAAAQPWLAPHEQELAGFEDDWPSVLEDEDDLPCVSGEFQDDAPGAVDAIDAPTRERDSGQVQDIILQLNAGCWVDLFAGQIWRRAQLVWVSTKGTLFMFTSHGGQPHSMTRRSCERLVMHDLLRPVPSHGVVANALSTLTSEAQAMRPGLTSPVSPGC